MDRGTAGRAAAVRRLPPRLRGIPARPFSESLPGGRRRFFFCFFRAGGPPRTAGLRVLAGLLYFKKKPSIVTKSEKMIKTI